MEGELASLQVAREALSSNLRQLAAESERAVTAAVAETEAEMPKATKRHGLGKDMRGGDANMMQTDETLVR